MAILISAVVLVGAIGLVNMLLTFGVIRRLREHTTMLSDQMREAAAAIMTAPGEAVQEFASTTTDGVEVSRVGITDQTLVAVLSTTCTACMEKLPSFVEQAAKHPGGRDSVLAVVVGGEGTDGPFMDWIASLVANRGFNDARVEQRPLFAASLAVVRDRVRPGGRDRRSASTATRARALGGWPRRGHHWLGRPASVRRSPVR